MAKRPYPIEPLAIAVAQAAATIGVSEQHFRDRILHELETVAVGLGTKVVVESLRRWVAEHKASPSATSTASGTRGGRSARRGPKSGPELEAERIERELLARVERSTRRRSGAKVIQLRQRNRSAGG